MIAKVVPIVVFILFAIVLFNMGVFTADFWGQVANNAAALAGAGANAVDNDGVDEQIVNPANESRLYDFCYNSSAFACEYIPSCAGAV